MIRVLIADDHHLVRQGIRALLEQADDIVVVGEADNGQTAFELAQQLLPDILLLDIAMPRLNGIQVVDKLNTFSMEMKCILLSMYSDEALINQALSKGVKGYLLKRSVAEELLLAIRSVYHGEAYLSPPISNILVEQMQQGRFEKGESAFDTLSLREREVLQLVAEGNTNHEIAEILVISVKTVEKHRANVMSKLNVNDLAGLIRIALKNGLIFIDE